jgi:hypothetical protein
MEFLRSEYPRPQFRREAWQSLNGEWQFDFDDAGDGALRGLPAGDKPLGKTINVPFSYQYPASGIGDRSQHDTVWYRRTFSVEKVNAGKRALLCFNGADYVTDVWVNGMHAVTHTGGFAPFSADITDYLKEQNVIVVRCYDPLDARVPRGKQSWTGTPFTCFYVPNTGIWQSVWLEFFGADCISGYALFPDEDRDGFHGEIETLHGVAQEAEITVSFEGKEIHRQRIALQKGTTRYGVKLSRGFVEDYSWSPETPRLLYVDFKLFVKGEAVDTAHTRFAMRTVAVDENGVICLNGKPLYQRLVLDQGYWTESGLTPPSAEALKKDIELSMALGFNGARKHQKLEDPYYYYYAEELGFLTWCEMPSAYYFCEKEMAAIAKEWQEILAVAKNQTSNICYVPLNESWGTREILRDKRQQDFARALYYLTKAIDGEKLVSTNDGFETITPTDLIGVHDYPIARAEEFTEKYGEENYDNLYPQGWKLLSEGCYYEGQPVLFTEFGGIAMQSEQKNGAWGYNDGAKDKEAFYAQLESLLKGIASVKFQGYCYTQLTDVQQEINGLLYPDRTPKFEIARTKKIFELKK